MHVYLLSSLLGVFIKLYDDLIDLSFNLPILQEIAKIVISILSIFIYFQNGFFCVIAFIVACISFSFKGFDDPFWYAYSGLLCICSISYLTVQRKWSWRWDAFLWNAYFLLFFLIGVYTEESIFGEEFSVCKCSARFKSIGITVVFLFLLEWLDLIVDKRLEVFVMLMILKNSYFITNLCMLYIYFLFQSQPKKQKKNKKKQPKHKKTLKKAKLYP
jgi:hypothetical protein